MLNPKAMLAILALSVALNAGLAAHTLKARGAGGGSTKVVTYSSGKYQLDSILRNLPAPKRKEFYTSMQKDFKQLRAYGVEAGKHRAAAKKLLLEPAVDKTAVNQHFATIVELNKQSDGLANTITIELLASLTPQERKAVMQRHSRTNPRPAGAAKANNKPAAPAR